MHAKAYISAGTRLLWRTQVFFCCFDFAAFVFIAPGKRYDDDMKLEMMYFSSGFPFGPLVFVSSLTVTTSTECKPRTTDMMLLKG